MNKVKILFLALISFTASFLCAPSFAQTLLGSADLDGTGVLQFVYLNGSSVKVSGRTTSYLLGPGVGNVVLLGMQEIDNIPGKELLFSATVNNNYHVIFVIYDRSQTVRQFSVGGSWVPPEAKFQDFDGDGATDLLLNVVGSNGLHEYRILHFASVYESNYDFSNYAPSTIFITGGIGDTDGLPGAEILVNTGSGITIIHDRNRSQNVYSIGSGLWTVFGLSDLDGSPGNEIALRHGSYVKVINDTTKTQWTSESVSNNFGFHSFLNMDSRGGNEIIVSIVSTGELKTITYFTPAISSASSSRSSSSSISRSSIAGGSTTSSSSVDSGGGTVPCSASGVPGYGGCIPGSGNSSNISASSSAASSNKAWLVPVLDLLPE